MWERDDCLLECFWEVGGNWRAPILERGDVRLMGCFWEVEIKLENPVREEMFSYWSVCGKWKESREPGRNPYVREETFATGVFLGSLRKPENLEDRRIQELQTDSNTSSG